MDSLKNLFAVSELRNRCLFTLGLLAVFSVGRHIPTRRAMNGAALQELFKQTQNQLFGLYRRITFWGRRPRGWRCLRAGHQASLHQRVDHPAAAHRRRVGYLEKLSKEGESSARRKITQYTRYGTILLSLVQSAGIAVFLERQTQVAGGLPLVTHPGLAFRLMTVLTLTTGTCFVMWLGEQITERGIGNGMSLIIFAGIVVNFPRAVIQTVDQLRTGQIGLIAMLILMVVMAFVVAAIIFVERGHRRVTVQHAKRVVGRRCTADRARTSSSK